MVRFAHDKKHAVSHKSGAHSSVRHRRSSPEKACVHTHHTTTTYKYDSEGHVSEMIVDERDDTYCAVDRYTKKPRLAHVSELSPHRQDNLYIHHHYRLHYSTKMCLQSFFSLHNESMNVWSHLFGIFVFVALGFYGFVTHNPHGEFIHYFLMGLFVLGAVACMACSSIYHLFNAHLSESLHHTMLTIDYFGVTILIVTSFIPVVYYTFVCHPYLQTIYLTMSCSCAVVGATGSITHLFWAKAFERVRVPLYCAMVISSIFPLSSAFLVVSLGEERWPVTGFALAELLVYGLGVLVYVGKVPERFFPGKFDIWFHSHQIWHALVMLAAVLHFNVLLSSYRLWVRLNDACEDAEPSWVGVMPTL